MKYYVSSKTKHADLWKDFRSKGVSIISSWIDEAGPGETKDFGELAERCLLEVSKADKLVLYAKPDEILKGTLIEVGAALALGKQVIFVGDSKLLNISRAFCAHRLWIDVSSFEEAFRLRDV